MEGLLDSVRHLTRELRLQMLIIDSFVPAEYQVCFNDKVARPKDIKNDQTINLSVDNSLFCSRSWWSSMYNGTRR